MDDWPTNYSKIAWLTHFAMRIQSKPCIGGPCDLDDPCKRHKRTEMVAYRAWRMRQRR